MAKGASDGGWVRQVRQGRQVRQIGQVGRVSQVGQVRAFTRQACPTYLSLPGRTLRS